MFTFILVKLQQPFQTDLHYSQCTVTVGNQMTWSLDTYVVTFQIQLTELRTTTVLKIKQNNQKRLLFTF